MKFFLPVLFVFIVKILPAASILVPMDDTQRNHLKAYGIAYYSLKQDLEVEWLLNYRGGSFILQYTQDLENECKIRGVTYEVISDVQTSKIIESVSSPAVNMEHLKMAKAPRVAVYSPKSEFILDETDAVISVLEFAEIPFDIIYDEEILNNALARYDWLHLHHEDFTGNPNRIRWRESAIVEFKVQEATANKMGFSKVSEMKLEVAKQIKAFCAAGGYLFAMCSAAETIDIALAAENFDISETFFDVEPDPFTHSKLDFEKTFAFEDFTLASGHGRRFSDINSGWLDYSQPNSYFSVFNFSAKWDVVPTLLTQNHTHMIKEFTGLTTSFNKSLVKPEVMILAENRAEGKVRYLYGELGKGHWTFYSGHDPEGSVGRGRGLVDLNLFPNSPGYRLILNNVLFPSAQKKKQKT